MKPLSRAAPRVNLAQLWGAGVFTVAWLGIAYAAINLSGWSWRALLIILNGAVLIWPFIWRFFRGRFDLFEPLLVANVSLLTMTVLRPLADIATGHFHEHAYDISTTFDSALLLVLSANAAFQLGYASPFGRRMMGRFGRVDTRFNTTLAALWGALIAVSGVGIYSIFLASNGGLGFLIAFATSRTAVQGNPFANASAYIYNAIGFLIPGSTILFGVWLKRKQLGYLIGSIAIIVPYLALFTGGGGRSALLAALFGMPLMWYAYRGKRPTPMVVLMAGLILFFVFSFLQQSRNLNKLEDKATVLQKVLADPIGAVLDPFTTDDIEMFDVMAQELEVVPNWVPYTHLGVIRDIFLRAIPKSLFPKGKPLDMTTTFFTAMEPSRARFSGAGTATSLIGDYYLDSGALTSVVYMFLTGIALSTVWWWFVANNRSLIALMIFSTLPAGIIGLLRGYLAAYLATIPFTVVPIVLLFYLQRVQLTQRR